jgi:hypothetical protein
MRRWARAWRVGSNPDCLREGSAADPAVALKSRLGRREFPLSQNGERG